jgi:hypothetical protein
MGSNDARRRLGPFSSPPIETLSVLVERGYNLNKTKTVSWYIKITKN